ncbi:DUF262 domain-containing protein [Paenibacillus sp. FSL W7-1088]|uniref:DUF262 domain-containing protein n=1 Tax=Paenibacillus sp. FSL W7-1088 TaxID=2921695 RepID=UPI0030EEBDB6
MAKQMQATPSTKKVSDIYSRLSGPSPTLILQPPFQRRFVWSDEHKEKLIDTIMNGLPIPEVYIAQSGIDLDKLETQEVVVDGQQRLSTILQYIDEPEDSVVFGNLVPKFKTLLDQDKRDFLNYNIVIRDLGDVDGATIIDIFKRINSTRYGLNDIELHNAIYDGKFITTAKEILEKVNTDNLPFLTESMISRMEDLYFILSLLATVMHGGYFSRDREIEKYIIEYNDKFEDKETYKKRFNEIFSFIEALRLKSESIWYRKSNYFTLFVEIYNRELEKLDFKTVHDKLIFLEDNVLENRNLGREENDFSKYYAYMYTGTTSRQARVVRGNILSKYVLNEAQI